MVVLNDHTTLPHQKFSSPIGELILKMTFLFRQPIILTTFSALMVILPTAPAQVVLDGTMGRSGELNGPNYQIGAELGQLHGSNLFHSFQDFNLTSSESAIFYRTNDVRNIISRVTGGNPSNINGTLGSEANLYFLNPYGIMFGPNARLDVQGSFHASTADTLRFEDGSQFNARNPGSSSLTLAPIEAFGFLSGSPAALSVTGSELSVDTGQTLSFIGGDLSIKNAAKLSAPAGQIDLVGVGSEGDAKLSNGFLDLSSFSQLADIYIEKSLVDASTDTEMGGKGINVRANNLTLNNGRLVSYTSGTGKGGDITIDATGLVELRLGSAEEEASDDDTTHASNELISVRTEGDGDGGHVTINARKFSLKEGRHIGTYALRKGQGGDIVITVTEDITIDGSGGMIPSIIAAQSDNQEGGSAGNVILNARTITLQNDAMINSSSAGQGDSGDISLVARQLTLKDGASISSTTFGPKTGGNIDAKVAESITIFGQPFRIGAPNGIFANSQPQINHPSELANFDPNTLGDAGEIVLETDRLIMTGSGPLEADKLIQRLGGSTAVIHASTIFGKGFGGKVDITVSQLELADGSVIAARSLAGAKGNAGVIRLNLGSSLYMKNGSFIWTTAEGAGGGKINITFQGDRLHLSDSEISSSVQEGEGGGGDITITGDLILLEGSNIKAQAHKGPGGNITINNLGLVKTPNSVIDASSELGIDGEVLITGKEENFEELLRLRDDFLRDKDQFSDDRCASSFIITNRDAPAENPTDLKNHLILDW